MSPLSGHLQATDSSSIASDRHSLIHRIVILPSTTLFPKVSDVTVNALTESATQLLTVAAATMASSTNTATITTSASSSQATWSIDSECGGFTIYESSTSINLACTSSVGCTYAIGRDNAFVYCPAPTPVTTALNSDSVTQWDDCWMKGSGCCYEGEKVGAFVTGRTSMWVCVPENQTSTIMPGHFNDNIFLKRKTANAATAAKKTTTSTASTRTTAGAASPAWELIPVQNTAPLVSNSVSRLTPTPKTMIAPTQSKYPQAIVIGVSVAVGVSALAAVAFVFCLLHRYHRKRQADIDNSARYQYDKRISHTSDTPILDKKFTGDGRTKPVFQKEGRTKYNIRHAVPMTPEAVWSEARKASLIDLQAKDLHELAEFGSTPTKSEAPQWPLASLPVAEEMRGTADSQQTESKNAIETSSSISEATAPPTTEICTKYRDIMARLGSTDRKIFLGYADKEKELIARMSRKQKEVFFRKSSPEQRKELLAIKSIGDDRSPSSSLRGRPPSLKAKMEQTKKIAAASCPMSTAGKKKSMPELRRALCGEEGVDELKTGDLPPLEVAKSPKRFASEDNLKKRMTTISEKKGE